MFEHCCFPSTGRIRRVNGLGNLESRRKTLNHSIWFSEEALSVNILRWSGHILHVPTERLFHCDLFCEAGHDGHSMTWHKGMETVTSGLARVGAARLPGLDPWDPPDGGGGMAQYCSRWFSHTDILSLFMQLLV